MSQFTQAVIKVVNSIPSGRVVSYGQVAAYVGVPRAGRQVGWILRSFDFAQDERVPWWRVINNQGRISIKGNLYHDANSQRQHLRAEDIEVGEDYRVDMAKYRYLAAQDQLKSWGLDTYYVQMIWNKFKRQY